MLMGIEGREPYLDEKIENFSKKYSNLNDFKNKKILKKLHERYFGKSFYDDKTPKQGFVFTYSNVINLETKKFTDNLFEKKFIKEQDIFNYNELEKIINKRNKNNYDLKLIYLLSCFQLWFKQWG